MGKGALVKSHVEEMVLLSVYAGGDSGRLSSELRRDLYPIVSHQLSPAEWRAGLDDVLTELLDRGTVELRNTKRLWLSKDGLAKLKSIVGGRLPKGLTWTKLKNSVLVARALGKSPAKALDAQPVEHASDLRKAILEKAFKLRLKERNGVAEIRRQLAEKAGGKPADGKGRKLGRMHLGAKRAAHPDLFTAEAAPIAAKKDRDRGIAARFLKSGRTPQTDGALITKLAAEQVGAVQTDVTALRLALLRRLLIEESPETLPPTSAEKAALAQAKTVAPPPPIQKQKSPDLAEFARVTGSIARERAEGWAGNRRAFISHVWTSVSVKHPNWGLDMPGFKTLLVDAHRQGLLSLTNADMREKDQLPELELSAVEHMNSVWHYIRVEG